MTPRCRPGDIAVVVRPSIPVNLGRIVRVIRPYRESGLRMRSASCLWLIEGAQPLTWDSDSGLRQERQGPVPDEALQPIRGQSSPHSPRLNPSA